jgi:peptidoglycan/LPS O-acetylase OafA/YrhL
MTEARAHVPEIDWLKGFAILCVVCIHAKLGEGTLFFEYVVNRAVPIFLVLFGVTSALSRDGARRTRLLDWYRPRLRRLVVPLWAMATAWWAAVLHFQQAQALHVGWPEAVATYAGYAPWIGTSWFITVILQLVVVYPALEAFVDRTGLALSLALGALSCVVCIWYVWDIVAAGVALLGNNVPPPGWFYFWIFSPRVLWDVIAGIAVARRFQGRPDAITTGSAILLTLVGVFAAERVRAMQDPVMAAVLHQMLGYLRDVPLTVGLLGLFRLLAPLRPLTRVLAWFGLHSWGLYLGHLLVHEVLHMNGVAPETGPTAIRAIYALILLVSGVLLTQCGVVVERAARQLARGRAGTART